jgi:hypothetical protein
MTTKALWAAACLISVSVSATGCGSGSSAAPSIPGPGPSSAPSPVPTSSPGQEPEIAGCQIFPSDNPWNQDVSGFPVDPNSNAYLASMNAATKNLHPDFGSNATYGIPFVVVPGSQPLVPMSFQYASESDPGPYPFPPNAPVESGSDRHVLVIDSGNCHLYETFASQYVGPGWDAGSGAVFDFQSNALRPDGWTSADAAGLPIFPGLVRYDEATAGAIDHALRFTVHATQNAFVHPATHEAGSANPALPPMGLRVRLKADYDLSRFNGVSKVVLVALKKYGMFVADNGSDWYISGETDTSWNDNDLDQLKTVPASAFEVVKLGPILH